MAVPVCKRVRMLLGAVLIVAFNLTPGELCSDES